MYFFLYIHASVQNVSHELANKDPMLRWEGRESDLPASSACIKQYNPLLFKSLKLHIFQFVLQSLWMSHKIKTYKKIKKLFDCIYIEKWNKI